MKYKETEEFQKMLASGMPERTAYKKIKALYPEVQRKARQSQKQKKAPYIVNKGEWV